MEDQTITIKLSPLLQGEIYSSVEAWVSDEGARVSGSQRSFANKFMAGNYTYTLAEAGELYDELYNLEDKVEEWAREEFCWYSVGRAIKSNMKKLKAFGVETDSHGWAII